jgi:hypothetical protein
MYIKCLIDTVLYLGRQGIVFRGHRKYETSVIRVLNILFKIFLKII